jgi:sigma-B regulation protein RsbU (phosphoserine phosphatase)
MNPSKINLMDAEILIVDDIPANLNVLRQALETEGYNIIAAPSGKVALQIAARIQPDLILLDIMMPEIDGFETCRRLKADPATADIPIIFITAKDETKSLVEGFRAGGVDYITKPFQYEEVRVRVQTHLTLKRLQDELREANHLIQSKNDALEKAYNQLEAENARKTEELETAREIQQGFLPVATPELPYLEIAAFQKTATEVGGDYYDFFLFPTGLNPVGMTGGQLIVAIGDATGHGVGAGLMVAATKTALLTIDEPDLTERMSKINTVLKQINSDCLLNMALALIKLSYDATSNCVQVKATGGGMPPLYVLRLNGEVEEIVIRGMPLGTLERAKYTATEFQLEKSDVLILMSDGLPERLNDKEEMLGDVRLVAEIEKAGQTGQSASGILEALVQSGDDWSNQAPQNDDVTLVVLKVK